MQKIQSRETSAAVQPSKGSGGIPAANRHRWLGLSLFLLSLAFGTTPAAQADEARILCAGVSMSIDAGELDLAMGVIKMAIDEGGEIQVCYVQLARLYLLAGKAPEAVQALDAALAIQESDPEAPKDWFRFMAMAQRGIGDFDESLKYYKMALLVDPSASLYAERGTLYSMLRRFDDAARDLRSARKLVPDNESYQASAKALDERHASMLFLDKLRAMDGATNTPMKVVYIVERLGTGPKPASDSTVTVHYHGTLRDGTVVDSSIDRGRPATMPLNKVIPCWSWALESVGVGSKLRVGCPPEQAYGWKGSGPIPPGAALHYEMELLAIE
jgi:FKBP-type peptidyl-prolyl cis-trans isomerase